MWYSFFGSKMKDRSSPPKKPPFFVTRLPHILPPLTFNYLYTLKINKDLNITQQPPLPFRNWIWFIQWPFSLKTYFCHWNDNVLTYRNSLIPFYSQVKTLHSLKNPLLSLIWASFHVAKVWGILFIPVAFKIYVVKVVK